MFPIVQGVVAVSLMICAGCLCSIAKAQKQQLGHGPTSSGTKETPKIALSCCTDLGPSTNCGYGVYAFRDGTWQLQADLSAPGYEVTPPTIPGRHAGQVVRREAQPRS